TSGHRSPRPARKARGIPVATLTAKERGASRSHEAAAPAGTPLSCRNEYLIRVNIYARRGIPTSALPHLVRDHCAAFPTILIGNQIADSARGRFDLCQLDDVAQISRFCTLAGGLPLGAAPVAAAWSGVWPGGWPVGVAGICRGSIGACAVMSGSARVAVAVPRSCLAGLRLAGCGGGFRWWWRSRGGCACRTLAKTRHGAPCHARTLSIAPPGQLLLGCRGTAGQLPGASTVCLSKFCINQAVRGQFLGNPSGYGTRPFNQGVGGRILLGTSRHATVLPGLGEWRGEGSAPHRAAAA